MTHGDTETHNHTISIAAYYLRTAICLPPCYFCATPSVRDAHLAAAASFHVANGYLTSGSSQAQGGECVDIRKWVNAATQFSA